MGKAGDGESCGRGGGLRDSQCELPRALCGRCRGEMYRRDILYRWEGRYLCASCMEDLFAALSTREKAELLGAAAVRAGALEARD